MMFVSLDTPFTIWLTMYFIGTYPLFTVDMSVPAQITPPYLR
jgi:hypothetical protein